MANPNIGIQHWRFYKNDNADVDSCTAVGLEDSVDQTRLLDVAFMVRMSIWNDTTGNYNTTTTLQARRNGGSWFNVTGSSSYVRSAAGLPTDGAACDTQLLTSHGSYSWENDGGYDEADGATPSISHAKSSFWEDQWCVVIRSAECAADDTIEFRVDCTGGTETDPGTYPKVTAATPEEYTGSGAGTLAALAQSAGVGAYGYPGGQGAGTLSGLSGAGTGTIGAPQYSGAGAGTLAALTATGTGTFQALLELFDSTHIAASGEDTTERLTGPGSGAFAPGRIQDDENPADAVSANLTGWVEWEWPIKGIVENDYEFRVLDGSGTPITSDVTPELGVATAGFLGAGAGALGAIAQSAGAGSYADPQYADGAGDGALAAVTCAATGTYADPQYSDGAGAGTLAAATGSAAGTYADAVYAGDGAATLAAISATAAGAYADPQYADGAGDGTLAAVTCAADGSYAAPGWAGDGAATLAAITGAATGTSGDPSYSGDGAATLAAITAVGTGAIGYPAGEGAGTLAALTAQAAGSYADATYAGDGAGTLVALTATGAGSFADATYTGDGAGTLAAVACAATGTYSLIYDGAGAATLAPITGTGEGSYSAQTYLGDAAGTLGAITGSGAGSVAGAAYSGDGAGTLAALTAAATGTWQVAQYTGDGAGTLAPITCSAAGTYAGAVYSGAGDGALAPISCAADGSYADPSYSGAGAGTLAPITAAGTGAFSVTEELEGYQWLKDDDVEGSNTTLQVPDTQITIANGGKARLRVVVMAPAGGQYQWEAAKVGTEDWFKLEPEG